MKVIYEPNRVEDLPDVWRAMADAQRKRGLEAVACAIEDCAADLEACQDAEALEELTLEKAARESGYSYKHLSRMVSAGEIPNAGTSGSPRIHREDLPRRRTSGKEKKTTTSPRTNGSAPPSPSEDHGPRQARRVLAQRANGS